jgi:hypothetical protein
MPPRPAIGAQGDTAILTYPDPFLSDNFDQSASKQGGFRADYHGHRQADHRESAQERAQRTAVVRRLIAALESPDD